MLPKPWLSVGMSCFETEWLLHWSSSYTKQLLWTREEPGAAKLPSLAKTRHGAAGAHACSATTRFFHPEGVLARGATPGAPPCPSIRGCPAEAMPASHRGWSQNMLPYVPHCGQGGTRSLGPKQVDLKRCRFTRGTGQCSCLQLHGYREVTSFTASKMFFYPLHR